MAIWTSNWHDESYNFRVKISIMQYIDVHASIRRSCSNLARAFKTSRGSLDIWSSFIFQINMHDPATFHSARYQRTKLCNTAILVSSLEKLWRETQLSRIMGNIWSVANFLLFVCVFPIIVDFFKFSSLHLELDVIYDWYMKYVYFDFQHLIEDFIHFVNINTCLSYSNDTTIRKFQQCNSYMNKTKVEFYVFGKCRPG